MGYYELENKIKNLSPWAKCLLIINIFDCSYKRDTPLRRYVPENRKVSLNLFTDRTVNVNGMLYAFHLDHMTIVVDGTKHVQKIGYDEIYHISFDFAREIQYIICGRV